MRPFEVETIIVTASPIAGSRDRFATIVETVDRGKILQSGGANLGDTLAQLPGITGTGFAAGASRPVIRGFDANRVRVLENGVGSFDVSEVGPDHGIPIDPLAAQRIEVVRGAATLRYGSQAIGGIVNTINNRVPQELPDGPFSAEGSLAYDTTNDGKEGSALYDGRIRSLAVHVDGFARNTDDYDTPLGRQANSFFEGTGYSAGASYFLTQNNRFGAAIIRYDAEYGIPAEDAFIDMEQTKGLFGANFNFDEGLLRTLEFDAGIADYSHSEIVPGEPPASTFNDEEWDMRAEAVSKAFGPFSAVAVGSQLQNRDFSALGEGADYLLPTTTNSYAGFGFAEAPLGARATLQLAARGEHVSVEGTPLDDVGTKRDFDPVSASAGVLIELTQAAKLGLTLSSAARAPAQSELYARGPHEATATYEIGNPAFGLERANSLEGTLRLRSGVAEFEGSLWGAKYSDYIFGQITGRTCSEDGICVPGDSAELKELVYEQRDAEFWGAEGKAEIALLQTATGSVKLNILADLVRARFASGGDLPRIPPVRIGGGASWEGSRLDAGILAIFTERQDDIDVGSETATKSFVDLGAHLTWRPFDGEGLELSLVGRNLTDDVQRIHAALNKDEVIRPGRNIRFVVRMRI